MSESTSHDAVVIGAGPNGLAAAALLVDAGLSVLVVEAQPDIGGGTRTAELTAPGYLHDVCSAVHPLGYLSPYLCTLPLAERGLQWVHPPASVAHPLDTGEAILLYRSVGETAQQLGVDGAAYERLMAPFVRAGDVIMGELLGPLRWPRHPLLLARFGLKGLRSARGLARSHFRGPEASALFAGCAAHSIMSFDKLFTGAVGLLFGLSGHLCDWPMARGGSAAIAAALAAHVVARGGRIETGHRVTSLSELPSARAYLFDTAPKQLSAIAGDALPAGYHRRLARYRYGPGVFKVDWALSGPIPWRDPRCLEASTVHLGGGLDEIAEAEGRVFAGEHAQRPFVLVAQQSLFDDSRVPPGGQTAYAYCHVPHGSDVDQTDLIEAEIERQAPGFRDLVVARASQGPAELERHNQNYVGGVIAGGVADWRQMFTRPVARLDPYTTPNPALFICSASTPPGGGVHGMCGYWAARSVLRRRFGRQPPAGAIL